MNIVRWWQVSIHGAGLTGNKQAENSKQAFAEYPQEIFSRGNPEMFKIFQGIFALDRFTYETSEKPNPLNQMMIMQEVLIVVQNRCVRAHDDMSKVIVSTIQERPGDLNQRYGNISARGVRPTRKPGRLSCKDVVPGSIPSRWIRILSGNPSGHSECLDQADEGAQRKQDIVDDQDGNWPTNGCYS